MRKSVFAVLASAGLLCGALSACTINAPAPHLVSSDQDAEAELLGTQAPSPNSAKGNYSQLSIGVDTLGTTFNPHIHAGDNPVTRLIASLTLPSAFVNGQMNTDLLSSAQVIDTSSSQLRDLTGGQTVRYVINPSAQWSDGSPLTGSDFSFLWQQMTSSPNVINAAGYSLIDKIATSTDGRTVDVHFSQPYTEWNTLFDNLLPSHTLRGNTDFNEMLKTSIPSSAGKYQLIKVSNMGVATFKRNDRYWGSTPALAEQIIIRAISMAGQMGTMLARQNLDAVDTNPSAAAEAKIKAPNQGIQAKLESTDRTLDIIFNQSSNLLINQKQRAAVANLIDFNTIYSTAVDSVYSQDLPDRATIPASNTYTEGNRPIRVGADPDDALALAVAESLVSSFRIKGYASELITEDESGLASQDLPNGSVDIAVAWQRTPNNISTLASQYGCEQEEKSTNNSDSVPTYRRDNLSGFCSSTTESAINAALSGTMDFNELQSVISTQTSESVVSYPLIKELRIQAVGTSLVVPDSFVGKSISSWPQLPGIGIFSTVSSWSSISRENED
ncbi:MAG: ABC transporter substrate-binding protein [Corynebacterium sp.]|nr:ABC transporter substrate-binding protein [Corynebacterium sp.]